MKLSIVTINYNNREGLERTIKSVVEQTERPFEYIIVDGGSTDGGVEVIHKYLKYLTKWVSEPDGGLYQAINKGTRMASGEYCLYLNSGDTLHSNDVVAQINSLEYTDDFMEGRAKTSTVGVSTPPPKYTLGTFLHYRNPYHQACLIKRTMVLERPYDESYRIAADLAFNIDKLVIHGCSYRPLDIIVCDYEGGGRSETIAHQDEIDRVYSIIPARIMEDYVASNWLYRFPAKQLQPFLHSLVRSVFLYRCRLILKIIAGKKITNTDRQNIIDRKSGLV